MTERLAPPELALWLEWSSGKLLSLREGSPLPSGYRNFWPEFEQRFADAYGTTRETLRAPLPSAAEISLMDVLQRLPNLIADPGLRKIVRMRTLIAPVRNRHVYSFPAIAAEFGVSRQIAAQRYQKGLRWLAAAIPLTIIPPLRKSFTALS